MKKQSYFFLVSGMALSSILMSCGVSQDEFNATSQKLAKTEKELSELKVKNERDETSYKSAVAKVAEQEETIKKLQSDLDGVHLKLKASERKAKDMLSGTKEGLGKTVGDLKAKIAELEGEKEQLAKQLAEATAKLDRIAQVKAAMATLSLKAPPATKFYVSRKQLGEIWKEAGQIQESNSAIVQKLSSWLALDATGSIKDKRRYENFRYTIELNSEAVIKTDMSGKGSISKLRPGEYVLIGIYKDDSTSQVTIWSKVVKIDKGNNDVSVGDGDIAAKSK